MNPPGPSVTGRPSLGNRTLSDPGCEEYLPSTVVFWTEVVKLTTSVLLVVHESSRLELVSVQGFLGPGFTGERC